MELVLTIIHLLACFVLMGVVLIQKGKGADLAGAFGGGGSQSSIGVRTATQLIHKMTIGAAIFFMITSYTLGLVGGSSDSLIEQATEAAQEEAATAGDQSEQPDASQQPAAGSDQTENEEAGNDSDTSQQDDAGGDGESVEQQ